MKGRIGLGIDAGGTNTKLVLVAESGRTLAAAAIATSPGSGPENFVRRVVKRARALEREARLRAPRACLGIAGDVDVGLGCLRRSPNMRALEGYPLGRALSRALERPVAVHNDANMAAWGCYAIELGRRRPTVVGLTMGTGIGGGLILDRRLYTGATGSAGEIGHARVAPGGELCGCGALGCLEAYAGKFGIARLARRIAEERPADGKRWRERLSRGIEPLELARAARRGDALALELWRRVGRALGVGLVNVVYLFNPDAIVLAGGVAGAARFFLGPVREAFRGESFHAPFRRVKLHLARGAELGARGAALYSLEE